MSWNRESPVERKEYIVEVANFKIANPTYYLHFKNPLLEYIFLAYIIYILQGYSIARMQFYNGKVVQKVS